ncbi:Ino80 complex protein [Malassezia pachydermatis]
MPVDASEVEEMSDDFEQDEVDYDAGEPESDQSFESEDEEDEEDELVDEMEDSTPSLETNRRSRRAPLRVKLMRRNVENTPTSSPSRRSSSRVTKRTTRARMMDDGEEDEDEEEDDELADDDSDADSVSTSDMPMTARQIARANRARGIATEELVELPMGPRKQKLSETELALRRSETARRRRNQSEKKLEDDKIETINRLLKKQAGKVRGRDKSEQDAQDEPVKKERDLRANHPQPFFRYINRAQGSILAVPLAPPYVQDQEGGEGLYDYTLRTAFGKTPEAWATS